MDTTENLLIKICNILDSLHGLFDWRNPAKCKAVGIGLAVSAVAHLFIPFNRVLWVRQKTG